MDPQALDAPPRERIRRHGPLMDWAVAIAVFAYNLLVQGIPSGAASLEEVLVTAGLCLPYPWRRRHPTAAYTLIVGVAFVQLALGLGALVADLMIVLALAGLASRRAPARSIPAAGVALAWVVLLAVIGRDGPVLSIGDVALFALMAVTAWVWGQLARTRGQYIASLQERAERLERERETQARIAAAEERARIAREFHDVVSHGLSAVTLLADGAAATVDTDPDQARRAMILARDTSREATAQMRSMLGVLRAETSPGLAPQPGAADLGGLVDAVRDAGTPVRFDTMGDPQHLPSDVQLTVYRVVQEGLTNVRKHAGPGLTEARVAIDYGRGDEPVRVRIADDGGDAPADASTPSGHGLVGMQERVAAHGGCIHAGPGPAGFDIDVELPARRTP